MSKFRNRIFEDDNDVFLIIAGKRGSTKSGSAISMGYQLDINYKGNTRFYLDPKYFPRGFNLLPGEMMPRVIYKPSQLMDMLKDNSKYPMGTCIVWDEVGVEGDARDFAHKKNKLLKRTMQTMRSLNWFIELTAVTVKDFDIAFERNAGFYMKMEGKTKIQQMRPDGTTKELPYGRAKIYEIDVNATTGKKYYKSLRYTDVDGKHKVLSGHYYVRKPPSYLETPYKRYKHLFQTKLYSGYADELDNINQFELDDTTHNELDIMNEKIKEIMNNPGDYFDYKKRKFILAAIQYEGDIKIENDARARKIMQLLSFKARKGDLKLDKK